MPVDPKYLREHATQCWTLAAQTDNPLLKNSLLKVAQRNVRLAVGLEEHHQAKLVLRLITPEMLWGPPRQRASQLGYAFSAATTIQSRIIISSWGSSSAPRFGRDRRSPDHPVPGLLFISELVVIAAHAGPEWRTPGGLLILIGVAYRSGPAHESGAVSIFDPLEAGAAVQFTAAVNTLGVSIPATTTMEPLMTKTRTRSERVATTNFIGCLWGEEFQKVTLETID